MRKKLLLGNWKMNKLASEAKEFALASVPFAALAKKNNIEIGVAPTYLSLATVKENASKDMIVAAQNVHFMDHGAYDKMKALFENDMVPVYCVGETLAEFEAGQTKEVVGRQVRDGLKDFTASDVARLVIAYEPVWSIGTGKNASSEIAQDICSFIRGILREVFGEVAEEIRVLYGGSVKPVNVKEYLSCPDVDGALVGGASLKIESFEELLTNIL